jgi:hypothetical protein
MNIFVLHNDPVESARMMCDKHVVKMILESCQLLSTAHHVLDGSEVIIASDKRKYKSYISKKADICKATMINHPCTIWVRENRSNYIWLWKHAHALCNEYKQRYGKTHAMEAMLFNGLFNPPDNISKGKLTAFPQAMPDSYKDNDAVIAYRRYYLGEKVRFAKWKAGGVPEWFVKKDPIVGLNETVPF